MMDYDGKHKRRLYQYLKEVERLFERLIAQTSSIAIKLKLKEELFRFKKHPKAIKDINKVLNEYQSSLLDTIQVGTQREWHLANEKIDALQKGMLHKITGQVAKEILLSEFQKIARSPRNTEALKSFQEQKVGDFTLSDRVWNITSQMREELEFAIDVSLTEGKSANELAREIKKLLNEPDRLYRRVKDKHGNLVLSKNAKTFKPGQGVYRSSHKNALRLAKEEINTAYRESEQLRILQNNDVVGIEIHLSPSHKVYDICDELKGKYPKDFKWSKWHIGCMCHRRVIMKSEKEFINELKNGENLPPESSENYVADVPNSFKKWHKDNEGKFTNWKRLPNFLEENRGYLGDTKKEGVYNSTIDELKSKNIEYNKVKSLKSKLTEGQIVARVGGGDLTQGSCASLCLAYAGNKVNLDVLDFRDGESRTYFARKIDDVIKLAGGFVEKDYNDFKAINKLLKNVEIDKEYILSTGRHASIIRKSKERGWEYLELQSPSSNGYKPLDNKKLQSRFDCKKSRTHYGQKIELVSSLIDIEKLNTEDFKTLLGYINTEGTMQKKGERGRTR